MTHHLDIFMSGKNFGLNGLNVDDYTDFDQSDAPRHENVPPLYEHDLKPIGSLSYIKKAQDEPLGCVPPYRKNT